MDDWELSRGLQGLERKCSRESFSMFNLVVALLAGVVTDRPHYRAPAQRLQPRAGSAYQAAAPGASTTALHCFVASLLAMTATTTLTNTWGTTARPN